MALYVVYQDYFYCNIFMTTATNVFGKKEKNLD